MTISAVARRLQVKDRTIRADLAALVSAPERAAAALLEDVVGVLCSGSEKDESNWLADAIVSAEDPRAKAERADP